MAILHIDTITAAAALASLGPTGQDLAILAQSIDEDWKRFAPPPASGSRHLISTMGNRQNCPPTGLPYYNAQLLKPDLVDAAKRPIRDRFLKGAPLLCAEVTRDRDEYRLDTVLIKIGMRAWITIDREAGRTTYFMADQELPDTALAAAAGRRLGEIASLGIGEDAVVTSARPADAKEMRGIAQAMVGPGIALDTPLPGWSTVEFQRIYAGEMK